MTRIANKPQATRVDLTDNLLGSEIEDNTTKNYSIQSIAPLIWSKGLQNPDVSIDLSLEVNDVWVDFNAMDATEISVQQFVVVTHSSGVYIFTGGSGTWGSGGDSIASSEMFPLIPYANTGNGTYLPLDGSQAMTGQLQGTSLIMSGQIATQQDVVAGSAVIGSVNISDVQITIDDLADNGSESRLKGYGLFINDEGTSAEAAFTTSSLALNEYGTSESVEYKKRSIVAKFQTTPADVLNWNDVGELGVGGPVEAGTALRVHGVVKGVTPTTSDGLTTKAYVDDNFIANDTSGGGEVLSKIWTGTQANYNNLTPVASTFYIIVG